MESNYREIKSPELTVIEIVLINLIYKILQRQIKLAQDIVKLSTEGKFKEVIDTAQELSYITGYKSQLDELKDQFFEHASITTLNKIISEDKFAPHSQWGDPFLISKEVLRSFRYGVEIKQDNPKAAIAKHLGAKIIV